MKYKDYAAQNCYVPSGTFKKDFQVELDGKYGRIILELNHDHENKITQSMMFILELSSGTAFGIYNNGKYMNAVFIREPYIKENIITRKFKTIDLNRHKKIKKCTALIMPINVEENDQQNENNNDIFKEDSYYGKMEQSETQLKKTEKWFENIVKAKEGTDALGDIQLVNSPYDHDARYHKIENRIVEILFYDENKSKISTFTISAHYCFNCKKHYDYRNSFFTQIRRAGIDAENIITRLIYIEGGKFSTNRDYGRKRSILSMCGYAVGYSGYSPEYRHSVLDVVILSGVMRPVSVKRHLNTQITKFSNKPEMEDAVYNWKEDVEYINQQIKNGKYLNY